MFINNLSSNLSSTYYNQKPSKMAGNKDAEKDGEILEHWTKRWEADETIWQRDVVNVQLVKYFEGLRILKGEVSEYKVFVPLCGKTLDIKWLLDKGCSVVGVEGVDKAIQQLFQQHDLTFNTKPLQNEDTLYQCQGLPLKVYKCNVFDLPKYNTEKFDLLWDRGAFVAVTSEQRERYAAMIKNLYTPHFSHLLESYVYECDTTILSPNSIPLSVFQELLGSEFKYEQLEHVDYKETFEEKHNVKCVFAHLKTFLISRKDGIKK